MRLIVLLVTVLCGVGLATEYQSVMSDFSFWSNSTVGSPELFVIDKENRVLVLAAKNSLCHISLDLSTALNIQDTKPSEHEIEFCMTDGDIFQSEESCQNFHHVLVFPNTPDVINVSNAYISVNETVLACGSNAYQPKCTYRNRTNLSIINAYEGKLFCPYGRISTAKAIVTNEGRLVSGSSQNIAEDEFGIALSTDPFTGQTLVRTINNKNMFKNPTFIDLHEIGDYYYVFMSEPASEATDITYSRVGRICKNDSGVQDSVLNNQHVFTSFLKARMSCSSQDDSQEFAYYYDNLKDTVYYEDGSWDGKVTGRHLYAVLSSPVNGPDGSVLCVYSFDGGDNDLMGIFRQDYLQQMGANNWVRTDNNNPVSCDNHRTVSDAKDFYLMEPTATQTDSPLIKIDGMVFQRLIVDRVKGVNGETYEVIVIAANEQDFLKVLKITYLSSREGDKAHISQATKLFVNSNSSNEEEEEEQVVSMDLYKTDSEAVVYLSTNQRIYRVPIADCAKYSGCRSCVESRDPYCAYDRYSHTCVTTLPGYTNASVYLQDIDKGDYSKCTNTSPSSTSVPTPSSTVGPSIVSNDAVETRHSSSSVCPPTITDFYTTITSTVTTTISVSARPSQTPTMPTRPTTPSFSISTTRTRDPRPTVSGEPNVEGVSSKTDGNTHTYTLLGVGGAGIFVGIAIGMILFACLRNKDKFIWGKLLSRNRRLNFSDDEEKHYELHTKFLGSEKNNSVDYEKPSMPRPSTPPLTKNNPTSQPGTESPVLSKYTKTGKTHNRSLSSGGQFPIHFPLPLPYETPGHHSPVLESPVSKNVRNTFHVEEGVSNSDRQRYGKNMVCKQLSREYPVTASDTSSYFHSKTNSLDLDGWKAPR